MSSRTRLPNGTNQAALNPRYTIHNSSRLPLLPAGFFCLRLPRLLLPAIVISISEFGDRKIVFELLWSSASRGFRSSSGPSSPSYLPLGSLNQQQGKSDFAQQGPRDRCLPMDELRAALRRVSELGCRKRIDACAASVSRLEDGYPLPARASSRAAISPAPTTTTCGELRRSM